MKISQKIIALVGFWLAFLPNLSAQNAIAVSSNPGPGLHVALNWSPSPKAVGYNIFRKGETDLNYPITPLNTLPIVPAASCATIKSYLITAPDSAAWKMVSKALADSNLFNPCLMNTLAKSSEKYKRLLMLTKRNMPIAKAAGLGYEDKTVILGKVHYYRIVALDAANNVIEVATNMKVTVGSFVLPAAPASLVAEPGDAMVQIRWDEVTGAAGYAVERSTNPVGIYQRVNSGSYSTKVKNHLNGDTLIPGAEGFVDFQYYNPSTGKPISHLVGSSLISGPYNAVKYYYRVRSLDFFDRAGLPSVVSNAAMPLDTTKPSVPNDMVATPDTSGKVTIRWTQVTKDVNGHWEQPDSSVRHRVYRFASSEDPTTTPSVLVGEVATVKGLQSKDTVDADPGLRGAFGNRTWWYRIRTVDKPGNVSQWSSAVSAIVKDKTPPAIVFNTTAQGLEDQIRVKWKLNSEPDMASYMVYRSLCHLGSWVECSPNDTCKQWVNYDPLKTQPDNKDVTGATNPTNRKVPCPCSGPFVFLGEITHDSAKRAETAGKYYFYDLTIPKGSPLCYAYWIKAKDSSDNLSGTFPLPSAAERAQIFCQRLRDLTPPDPALISGLFAQADQIRVEWMGPPSQDTRAYHVYRAEGKDPAIEPPTGDFKWVGGMTVELPPTLPKILTAPYTPPSLAPCDKISVQATQWMSQGRFDDKTIDPKKTYWYRAVGIDYDGNETPLGKAAAISTFTFSKLNQPAPVLMSITKLNGPCRVILQWLPTFDPNTQLGFIIYRGSSATGPFTPIVVSPLKSNSFTDEQVVQGVTYWYRIGLMMKNGRLSDLTAAQSITP